MKIITLSNEKGGVGKTTLAMHIAMGMALRGARVMFVDSDAQGNATERCGVPMGPGFYDLIVRDSNWSSVAKVVKPEKYGLPGERLPERGALWVVPSNGETINVANSVSNAMVMAERLQDLEGEVDLVVIDTSPTPSLLHASIYMATDYIIYPTTATMDSLRGLGLSNIHRAGASKARQDRYGLPGIKVMGIVPTLYRKNTVEQELNLDALRKHQQFGHLVWNPMPLRTIWTETESQRAAVWSLDPNHPAAMDAWELIDRVQENLANDIATQAG